MAADFGLTLVNPALDTVGECLGTALQKQQQEKNRRTLSIPGTGISYVEEGDGKRAGSRQQTHSPSQTNESVYDEIVDVSTIDIEMLTSESDKEFLNRVSKLMRLNKRSNFLLKMIVLFWIPGLIVLPIIGLFFKLYIHLFGKIDINYEMDEEIAENYRKRLEAWRTLGKADGLWQVTKEGYAADARKHAGVHKGVKMVPVKILSKAPFYLKPNIDILQVQLENGQLVFLPERILVLQGNKAGVVGYDDISFTTSDVQMIVESKVPKDTKIVNYTWKYVNKSGTPDKRFKDNRQLPICLYGTIHLLSNGLDIQLYCSNLEATEQFARQWNTLQSDIFQSAP